MSNEKTRNKQTTHMETLKQSDSGHHSSQIVFSQNKVIVICGSFNRLTNRGETTGST